MKTIPQYIETGFNKDTLIVETVICMATNKLYYQTRPFIRDGKLVIRRVAEVDILIENVDIEIKE